jgi:hypothetical protein
MARGGQRWLAGGSERCAHGFTARAKAQRCQTARRPFDYSRVLIFKKINKIVVVGAGETVENLFTAVWFLFFVHSGLGWLI